MPLSCAHSRLRLRDQISDSGTDIILINAGGNVAKWGALCPSKSGLMNKHIVKTYRGVIGDW